MNKTLLMFIDTETTGLSRSDRIVQIAWQLREKKTNILESSQCYIVAPTDYRISRQSSNIHGITHQIAKEKGISRQIILEKFRMELLRSDFVIAHNMKFDDRMISEELKRLECNSLYNLWTEKPKICTMQSLRKIYGKNLRLSDAFEKLTGKSIPEKIHSADVDTQMLAEVFLKIEIHRI